MPKASDNRSRVTFGDVEKLVATWVSSQQGVSQLLAISVSARTAAESVAREAEIDPEQLRQPVTL